MKTDILAILEGRVNPARSGSPRMRLFEMKRGEHSLVFQLAKRISHSGDVVADHAAGADPFARRVGLRSYRRQPRRARADPTRSAV